MQADDGGDDHGAAEEDAEAGGFAGNEEGGEEDGGDGDQRGKGEIKVCAREYVDMRVKSLGPVKGLLFFCLLALPLHSCRRISQRQQLCTFSWSFLPFRKSSEESFFSCLMKTE